MGRNERRDARALLGVVVLMAALLALSCRKGHAAAVSASDGWYTAEQAAHGHITFNSFCAECHRPDLTGAMGPALIGNVFRQTWINHPLGDLFDFEHTKMPANNPGSVPEAKLWDITAYILAKNGFAAGPERLGAHDEGRVLVAPPESRTK